MVVHQPWNDVDVTIPGNTEDERQSVWIRLDWTTWHVEFQEWERLERSTVDRGYELWEHALSRLTSDNTSLDRVDAVTGLKRAATQRIRALKEIYGLKELPLQSRPSKDLDLLRYLGIIRPLILRQLIEIRNSLEHEDIQPPSQDECLMFSDVVWYFLKSTDMLAARRVASVDYVPEEWAMVDDIVHALVTIDYNDPRNAPPSIRGWLKKTALAFEHRPDLLEISVSIQKHERDDDWIVFNGEVRGPEEGLRKLWHHYFARVPIGL